MIKVTKRTIKQSPIDIAFDVFTWCFLTVALLLVLYPLIYILSCSFSSPLEVTGGRVWLWPVKPSLMSYEVIFKYQKIWTGYLNSFIYMSLGSIVGVIVTILAAYPLARKDLVGKKIFSGIFLFTMLFSGGLVPTYLWIKALGLLDTVWVMVLPGAVSAWNIIIMRTYFQSSIPSDLYEAAELDGCSDIGILIKIVLPLSGPIIAVITLFFAVWLWNSYFSALIYLRRDNMFPLQIILRDILIVNQVDVTMIKDIESYIRKQGLADVLRYSLIVVASLPLLIIYPFVQRYFIKGVMIGSLKG
jgi:putative aldouronate transport system permease protein